MLSPANRFQASRRLIWRGARTDSPEPMPTERQPMTPKKHTSQKPTAAQCVLAASLFHAIHTRNVEGVVRIVKWVESPDSHADSDHGDSPLLSAARHSLPPEALEALLARSNPKKKNAHGETALILLARGEDGHTLDSIRLLLPLSDPKALSKTGLCALDASLAMPKDLARNITRAKFALLLPSADFEQRRHDGRTLLERARASGDAAILTLIFEELARREGLSLGEAIASPPTPPRPSSRL